MKNSKSFNAANGICLAPRGDKDIILRKIAICKNVWLKLIVKGTVAASEGVHREKVLRGWSHSELEVCSHGHEQGESYFRRCLPMGELLFLFKYLWAPTLFDKLMGSTMQFGFPRL